MTYRISANPSIGPAWEIYRGDRGDAVAHRREDAEAFKSGEIDAAELNRRNVEFEAAQ
jgi:hypothetical protein